MFLAFLFFKKNGFAHKLAHKLVGKLFIGLWHVQKYPQLFFENEMSHVSMDDHNYKMSHVSMDDHNYKMSLCGKVLYEA